MKDTVTPVSVSNKGVKIEKMSSSVKEQEKRNPSKTTSGNINRKGLKGKEEALGNNVFGYGHVAQAELYNRTVEELAEYVGKSIVKR